MIPGMRIMMKRDWEALKQEYAKRQDRLKAIAPLTSDLKGVFVRVDDIPETTLQSTLKEALQVAGCLVFIDYPGAKRAHALREGRGDVATAPPTAAAQAQPAFVIPTGSAIVRYSSPLEAQYAASYFSTHDVRFGSSRIAVRLLTADGEEAAYIEYAASKRKHNAGSVAIMPPTAPADAPTQSVVAAVPLACVGTAAKGDDDGGAAAVAAGDSTEVQTAKTTKKRSHKSSIDGRDGKVAGGAGSEGAGDVVSAEKGDGEIGKAPRKKRSRQG